MTENKIETGNDEWQTPDDLYEKLHEEFNFEVDLCAKQNNTKCQNWSEDIALFVESEQSDKYNQFWINPPYSRGNIDEAMSYVCKLHEEGKIITGLVRLDPTAKWFKKFVDGVASEVRLLDKRIRFKGASASYNFPCCVVVYSGVIKKPDGSIKNSTNYHLWGWK